MASTAQKGSSETNIELLPSSTPFGSIGGITSWVLRVGRYLIIFTEIVALAIFILSIKLSMDKNNLKDDISSLSNQVSEQQSFEREFRSVSERFGEVKGLMAAHFETNKVIAELLRILPQGMKLNNLFIDGQAIEFTGSFSKPPQLQTLVVEFSKSNKIVGLNIQELKSPDEDSPDFTFQAVGIINELGFELEEDQ